MQCWQSESLQLIQIVYHYMGGKESRCVVSHGVSHVTVVSRRPLVGKVAVVK